MAARKKEAQHVVKLQCAGGQATPAPPVGTALGPHGINIGEFVRQFNDATKDKVGLVIPVVISIYKDRTFSFVMKSPPASVLLKKAAGLEKAANLPGSEVVGTVTRAQLEEIVKIKEADLNASDIDAACEIIAGTARSMGLKVEG
ncbi:MAG: 50S ribosomal protein L11 [Planctomycetes bacterium]|jgi:large subunit ribosomal protein L11|nr:50S ribosomal protein L11 [Planctomycetota bacterium]